MTQEEKPQEEKAIDVLVNAMTKAGFPLSFRCVDSMKQAQARFESACARFVGEISELIQEEKPMPEEKPQRTEARIFADDVAACLKSWRLPHTNPDGCEQCQKRDARAPVYCFTGWPNARKLFGGDTFAWCDDCAHGKATEYIFTRTMEQRQEVREAQPTAAPFKQGTAVNRPAHYNMGSIEVIDAIEAWGLGFHEGNTVKYVARARHKGNELQDLKKAQWYLERRIAELEPKEAQQELPLWQVRLASCPVCGNSDLPCNCPDTEGKE